MAVSGKTGTPLPDESVVPVRHDITGEVWREYDFAGREYRIGDPVAVFIRPGGSTHRVLDLEGVVHCVPAPGFLGCVLRWMPRDHKAPVQF